MRLIGAIATGETPSADELSDGLSTLNDLLDSWSNEGLLIYSVTRETFPLTQGQSRYSIGVGGDFDTSRPQKIQEATILSSGNELPLNILNVQEYAAISIKTTTSNIPSDIYLEGTFPLNYLNLYPTPSSADSLVLYSLKPLSKYTLSSDTVSLPPGYARALRYNLALELSPEYGKPLNELIISVAQESKASIQRYNTAPVYMNSDISSLINNNSSFNIETGQ